MQAQAKKKKEREEKQTNENAKKAKGPTETSNEKREARNERNITKKLLQLARRGCGRGIRMAGGSELGTKWGV